MNGYRPEIDGLRAVAVLSVLLFHLGVPGFPGGYVGVDVFFVISGYLITRLICHELAQGRFTFRNFYMRRARRLVPAATVVFILSTFAACIMLSPQHLALFAKSLISALLFGSNFYFWSASGYFDAASSIKPLLHTWSLSVEEQFYMLWPAALVGITALRSRIAVPVVIVVLATASLGLNIAYQDDRSAIFYLLPFRVFELMIGAACIFLPAPKRPAVADLMTISGLGGILFAAVTFDQQTVFPSTNALYPCLGAALVVCSAGQARYSKWALTCQPMIRVGLVSYSLYLIHWPAIVFFRYFTMRELSAAETISLFAVSVCAADLLYRFVETPFRSNSTPKLTFIGAAVCLSVTGISIASTILYFDGWYERVPQSRIYVDLGVADGCGSLSSEPLVTCLIDHKAGSDIYVWGDSHARPLAYGLAAAFPNYNIKAIGANGCQPTSGLSAPLTTEPCGKHNLETLRFLLNRAPTNVIVHSYLDERYAMAIGELSVSLIDRLAAAGHKVKILGGVIRPSVDLVNCIQVPSIFSDELLKTRCSGDLEDASRLAAQNAVLAKRLGGSFVDPTFVFFKDGRYAPTLGNKLIFEDTNHLSPWGARYMVGLIANELMPPVSGSLAVSAP